MLTARLQARVPSARPLGHGRLVGHRLVFHKRGTDNSAKADALHTCRPADVVQGVLFDIEADERTLLDRAEGLGHGYVHREVRVLTVGGEAEAFTYEVQPAYYAPELRPFSWYLAYVLAGAREHGLPVDYVEGIAAETTTEDPDVERDRRCRRRLPAP
jgi:AIG2-like family